MSWLATALTILTLAADSRVAVYEQDDVRIEVTVSSQDFTYAVTNVGAPPLTRFEIDLYETYNATVPRGWTLDEERYLAGRLIAWTDDPARAIMPNRPPASFTARVTSSGAVLGLAPASLYAGDDAAAQFEGVWAPVPPRRSMLWLVAGTLVVLVLAYAAIARKK